MRRNFEDGVLERLSDLLGTSLLEFCLSASTDQLATGSLSATQVTCVRGMDTLRTNLLGQGYDDATLKQVVRAHFVDVTQSAEPLALTVRRDCGGAISVISTESDLESSVVELAKNVYPSFLLPPDEYSLNIPGVHDSAFVSRAVYADAANKTFEAAALADPVLGKVFSEDRPMVGRSVMINRSTLSGGTQQLSTLAGAVLQAAWRDRPDEAPLSLDAFIQASLSTWRFMSAAIAGEKQSIPVRIALAGVLLPDADSVAFAGMTLRPVTPRERILAPESIRGALAGSDAEGNSITINYEGDLVLECEYPFSVTVTKELSVNGGRDFSEGLAVLRELEQKIVRVRMALVLAVTRPHRVHAVSTWRVFDDPFNHGYAIGWSDPKQTVKLSPTQLTKEEVEAWRYWDSLLAAPNAEKLSLAISRIIRAIGERRDPVDALIDSVIAWENLFGSKEGEPTLRVTASLAVLLRKDYAERRKLRTKLAKIYALRSDVVHGSATPTDREFALCNESLDIAIEAVKAILERRQDLLSEGDSTGRSLKMLLGDDQDSIPGI